MIVKEYLVIDNVLVIADGSVNYEDGGGIDVGIDHHNGGSEWE